MPAARDLYQFRSGRLVAEYRMPQRDKNGCVIWKCTCDCGGSNFLTGAILFARKVKSCGCLQKEGAAERRRAAKQENPKYKDPEYRRQKRRARRNNPQTIVHERVSRLMAFALTEVGSLKRSATFDLLGYTPDDLRQHIERQFVKGMSWENRKEWQLDHIVPMNTAKTEEDVIRLNCLSNLRPMWSKANNQKNGRRLHLV